MLTSAPTVSATAPSSPSPAFHSHPRPHHGSRRPSSSSCAPSPRFQLTAAPSRRLDVPASTLPLAAASPAAALARSPQPRKREYADAGTQYSPHGFPPTYRPPVVEAARRSAARGDLGNSSSSSTTAAAPAPLPESASAVSARGETSATPVATEPPEPGVRTDPQPPAPARPARPTPADRRISGDGETQHDRQSTRQASGSTASQEQPSPAKRARPQEPSVKIMPLRYEACDVKDLGILISDMLMELVRLNDKFPLRDGQLTRFHSRAPPGISVRDYLFRLIVHATLSPPILLSMVFYVDKLCTMYPAFTISSLTVHRFLITSATVAAKGLSDSFWTNSLYARVGGVSVRELALLELEFLRKLEWRIVPKPETLVDYYKGLVERGEGYVMESDPDAAPTPGNAQKQPTEASAAADTDSSASAGS